MRAVLDLLPGDRQRLLVLVVLDQLGKTRRAGDVVSLADVDEIGLGANRQRLHATEPQPRLRLGQAARLAVADRLDDATDVIRRRATATADDVQPSVGRPLAQLRRERLGRLGKTGWQQRVRHTGVRVRADVDRCDARKLVDVRSHLLRAKRAVDPDAEQVDVGDGIPVRLNRLAGECAATLVGDGERQHHRQPLAKRVEQRLEREQRRPRIERVEHRLDQQYIHPALDQALGLLDVRLDQLVVCHGAEGRVVDVRRNGGCAIGRTKRTGDKTLPAGIRRHHIIGGGAGQLGVGHVQFVSQRLHRVIGQGDTGGVEGVRLDDIRPGLEIGPVNGTDHLRLGDTQ